MELKIECEFNVQEVLEQQLMFWKSAFQVIVGFFQKFEGGKEIKATKKEMKEMNWKEQEEGMGVGKK